ncbi:MAG: hypothetical protein KKA05_06870 [Alphaproteobacteria bacterium]|nr:hypothetical protein [Alphaproteobacteria bacterium]
MIRKIIGLAGLMVLAGWSADARAQTVYHYSPAAVLDLDRNGKIDLIAPRCRQCRVF